MPFRLEYLSAERKLLEAIRRRAPEHGMLDLRLIFQDGLFDVIFITGEERVRLR